MFFWIGKQISAVLLLRANQSRIGAVYRFPSNVQHWIRTGIALVSDDKFWIRADQPRLWDLNRGLIAFSKLVKSLLFENLQFYVGCMLSNYNFKRFFLSMENWQSKWRWRDSVNDSGDTVQMTVARQCK